MANEVKGLVEVEIPNGKKIKLLFDFNTWADAEVETGLKMKELVAGLADQSLSATHQRALFWCAMKEHQPEMTLREAGSILIDCAEALGKALEASMPEPEAEAGADAATDPPKALSGIGASN